MKKRIERIEAQVDERNIARNSACYKLAIEAVNNPGKKIRTGWTLGRGRYSSAQNHTLAVITLLRAAGIRFSSGNDAPRGGVDGNYVIVMK